MEVLYEYNTALMVVPKRDLVKYEIKTGDTEGLVNYLLTIEGMKLGALLIDRMKRENGASGAKAILTLTYLQGLILKRRPQKRGRRQKQRKH